MLCLRQAKAGHLIRPIIENSGPQRRFVHLSEIDRAAPPRRECVELIVIVRRVKIDVALQVRDADVHNDVDMLQLRENSEKFKRQRTQIMRV